MLYAGSAVCGLLSVVAATATATGNIKTGHIRELKFATFVSQIQIQISYISK
jgi:hypothetical protein